MACTQGCNDCNCEEIDTIQPVNKIEDTLNEKLRVFNDFICYIGNATCPSLPNLMAKFGFYVWCMLKDFAKLIICLYKRTNTLRKRDEELCSKLTEASKSINEFASITNKNNAQMTVYIDKMVEYQEVYKKYLVDKEDYDKAIRSYHTKSGENGYLVNPLGQALIFADETNAYIENISGGGTIPSMKITDTNVNLYNNLTKGIQYSTYSTLGEGVGVILKDGETLKVTYSGLKNSSYKDVKIAKVVFTYKTVTTTDKNGKTFYFLFKDPTKTVFAGDKQTTATTGLFEFDMTVDFLDESGNIIKLDSNDAIVSYASLNRTINSIEQVKNVPQDNFLKITGSTVDYKNGVILPTKNNSFKAQGSDYEYTDWDKDGSPLEYYGAAAAKYTRLFRVSVDVKKEPSWNSSLWFSYNTSIKAEPLPKAVIEPIKPEKPTLEDVPKIDVTCGDLTELPCGYLEV